MTQTPATAELHPLIATLADRLQESAADDALALAVGVTQALKAKRKLDGGRKLTTRQYEMVRTAVRTADPALVEAANGTELSTEVRKTVRDLSRNRLRMVEGLLEAVADRDEAVRRRALTSAARLLGERDYTGGTDRDAVRVMRMRLDEAARIDKLLLDSLKLGEATGGGGGAVAAPSRPASTGGERLGGRGHPPGDPVSRARAAVGAPAQVQPGNPDFEKLHPRGRGGTWIEKGAGMKAGEPPDRTVKQLQERLNELGFRLDQDGRFGVHTEEAVKAFQRKYGLEETGKVDASTIETMRNPPPKSMEQVQAEARAAETKKGSSRQGSGSASGRSRTGSRSGRSPDAQVTLNANDRQGIEQFQRDHGLTVTGKLDQTTDAAVKAVNADRSRRAQSGGAGRSRDRSGKGGSSASRSGDGGSGLVRRGDGMKGQPDSKVQRMQEQLSSLGFELGNGGVDGRFGEDTEAAVRLFQRRYGLRVDGVVGPETVRALQRALKRQEKEAKDQGHLSADQQEGVRLKHSAEEDKVEGKSLQEASVQGGVAVPYGGVNGLLTTSDEKGPVPWEGAEDLFGQKPPTMPPNLREAATDQFAACRSCVHHDKNRLCMLYSAGTDLDDLCDSWTTLTPESVQTRSLTALRESAALHKAQQGHDGTAVSRAIARYQAALSLLEAAIEEDDPEFESLVKKFRRNGMPEAAAKTAARKALSKRRMKEADEGIDVLTLDALVETGEPPKAPAVTGPQVDDLGLTEAEREFGHEDFDGAYWLQERAFPAEKRQKLAKKGKAMAHGGYPIENEGDLSNAIQAFGRAKNKAATKRHIIKRAKALGLTSKLPDGWLQEYEDETLVRDAYRLLEVKSSAYPDLPEKPNKTNWVEKAGGLPRYIERVAKHLFYEKGYNESRAIATAVSQTKKMCASGRAFGGKVSVSAKARATACNAVREWEQKRGKGRLKEAEELIEAEESYYPSLEECVQTFEEIELHEAAYPVSLHFDPRMHPRNRVGQFRDVLSMLKKSQRGSEVTMPHGVTVKTRRGSFQVTQGGKKLAAGRDADTVARRALDAMGDAGRVQSMRPFGIRTPRYNIAAAKLDPGTGGDRITQLRRIVARHQAGKVDGQTVDATTAAMLVKVHDALKPENQAKFGDVPFMRLVDFGWRSVRPAGEKADPGLDDGRMIDRRVRGGYNKQQSRDLLAQLRREHSDKTLPAALAHHGFVSTREAGTKADPGEPRVALHGPGMGGASRMAPDEYFWNYDFRFDLRDATRQQQQEVARRFAAAKLKPDGLTAKHVKIVEDVLGKESAVRKSPYAPRGIRGEPYTSSGTKADPGDRPGSAPGGKGTPITQNMYDEAWGQGGLGNQISEKQMNELADRLARASRKQGSPINAYHARASLDDLRKQGIDPRGFVSNYEAGRGEKADPGDDDTALRPGETWPQHRARMAKAYNERQARGEKHVYKTAAQEKAEAWKALLASPFKGTHDYHPGAMDISSPNVIQGTPIARGAKVRIVRGGPKQEKVDPYGKIVWVQDEHGNVQSVWRAALQRGGGQRRRRGGRLTEATVPRQVGTSGEAG